MPIANLHHWLDSRLPYINPALLYGVIHQLYTHSPMWPQAPTSKFKGFCQQGLVLDCSSVLCFVCRLFLCFLVGGVRFMLSLVFMVANVCNARAQQTRTWLKKFYTWLCSMSMLWATCIKVSMNIHVACLYVHCKVYSVEHSCCMYACAL
jgi:hypothetical protein